jgi:hypothetical protein
VHPDASSLPKHKIVDTFQENYSTQSGRNCINNELHLMEVECIEPDLYFNLSEGSLERFVNAIVELIK